MEQDTNTSILLNQSSMANEDGETERDFTTSYAVILIALAIIAGNCLVILTVKSFGRRLVADIFIFCLALLDLTHTLTSVLLAIIFKFTLIHKSIRGGRRSVFRVLCHAQAWFTVTTQLQSTFIITLITLERFVAVSRPFSYKTYVTTPIVIRTLAFLLLVSILFSSAPLVGWDEYVLFPKLALCMFRYNSSYAILIVVIGYTDLALVSYCFLAILVSLKKFMKRQAYFAKRRGAIAGPQVAAKDNNLSKMTKDGAMAIEQSKRLLRVSALVSFLFFLCWLPLMVAITLAQISNKTTDFISLIATLLPLTSPLVNPLIYFFSWERYKKSYIKIIKRFLNCWPYRRSIDRKDLTKVPGPNSAIRNHVRNSGLLGRLDLVQCEDNGEDMCSDNVSTPTPLVTQEQFFDKSTGSYSENGCDHLSNKESSGELRRYSYDEPKSPRRYTTIGCTHIESSKNFPEGCNSQKERRHTIGEFSEKAVRSRDWCTESTRKPLYRERCIIRSDEVIVDKREVFLTEQEDTKKRQIFKAQEGIHELYNGGILTDLEVRNQKKSRPWYKPRGERKSWKKKADYTVKTAEGPTKRETSFRRHPKRKAPRKNGGNDDIRKVYIRSKNIKEIKNASQIKKEKDPLKSLATENCPITERIGEYLANVIGNNEEWTDCREWRNSWEDWGHFEKDLESSQRESRHFLKERKVDGNELKDYCIECMRNSRKHSRGKIEDYRKEWENSRKELENSRNEWGNSRKECKHSRKELENSRKELESSQNECKNSRKELEDSQNKWRTSRNKWENSRHEYENSRHELEDSRNELEDSRNEWRNSWTELEDSQSEWEDSRKRWSDSWKERESYRMGATAPKQSRELLQEKTRREDNEGNFIIGNKSPTYKVDSDKKRGHKNRYRRGKMRIKKRSKNMESIRKSSLGNCNAKSGQDLLNYSQKTKRVAGNQNNQLRETVAESDKKGTLIWTYL